MEPAEHHARLTAPSRRDPCECESLSHVGDLESSTWVTSTQAGRVAMMTADAILQPRGHNCHGSQGRHNAISNTGLDCIHTSRSSPTARVSQKPRAVVQFVYPEKCKVATERIRPVVHLVYPELAILVPRRARPSSRPTRGSSTRS